MAEHAGYAALKERYGLPDIPHHVVSRIVAGARKSLDGVESYPPVYAPEDSLAGHLEFALKHEGVNLAILAELFAVVSKEELTAYIRSKPNGINTRRTWFFYEFLTGERLDIPDLDTTVGYVDALNPKAYVTRRGRRVPRYRVRDNLLGNARFCPVVRRTEALRRYSWRALRDKAAEIVRAYDAETLARVVNDLYTKETRSSFAIEHEELSRTGMERFGAALQQVRRFPRRR